MQPKGSRKFEGLWNDCPMLAFIEGKVRAAMLLPDEFRRTALDGVPPFSPGSAPSMVRRRQNLMHALHTVLNAFDRRCQKLIQMYSDVSVTGYSGFGLSTRIWVIRKPLGPR